MEIHALLINMRRSADRLEYQRRQLDCMGIGFERLEAVDAADISDREFGGRSQQWQRPLSRPEVGCFLSHRLVWQRVVEAGRPLLVLEDDAVLSDHLAAVLAGLTPSAESLIYNLETGRGRKLLSIWPTASLPLGHSTVRIYRDSGGSAAYIITPEAAAACLKRAERHTAPADAFLNAMPRLQIEPGLAVQMEMLAGMLQGDLRATAVSTMRRMSTETSVLRKLVRRPRMKLRRLDSNLQTAALQVMTLVRAKKRWVPYCPSIEAKANLMQPQERRAA